MNTKFLRILGGLAAALLLLVLLVNLLARPIPDHPYYADRPAVMVIAHQGGDGLWPGDTLFAFQNAASLGVDVLEMDLHITRDGVLVLIHDETVDRTTNGKGAVEEMTLAELKSLDAGYRWSPDGGQTFPFRGQGITIPTIEEVFQTFPNHRMVIEIKKTQRSMAAPFCALIRQYGMQNRVLVASFHDERMNEFRAACPKVATSAARQETTSFVLLSKVFLGGLVVPAYQSLQVPEQSSGIRVLTTQFVRATRRQNLKVEPWTIDDPAQMQQYIEWGIDGIITDRPDLLLKVLGRSR